jgi:hypothetical protein
LAKQTDDLSRLVAAAANRLRLIQIDFADEQPEVRRGYLSEAVEAALADVVPQQRQTFLQDLMARFPTWDPNVVVTAPLQSATVGSPTVATAGQASRGTLQEQAQRQPTVVISRTDERELQDPSFLVERLGGLAGDLSDQEKEGIVNRLREVGLVPPAQGGMPEEPLRRLRKVLGLKPDAPLDAPRILSLLATLVDFVCSLDPLVWRTWGKLAPQSKFQSIAALRHVVSRFASGDQAVTEAQAEDDLLKLRHLIASVTVALGQAGKIAATDVATSFMAPLAPAKIRDLVKFEKGGFFVAEEVKCWRKYEQLAGKLTDVAVEGAIREKVQKFIEELMKQRAATRPEET